MAEQVDTSGGWRRYNYQRCDLCTRMAWWAHADGGFRCRWCPKPGWGKVVVKDLVDDPDRWIEPTEDTDRP